MDGVIFFIISLYIILIREATLKMRIKTNSYYLICAYNIIYISCFFSISERHIIFLFFYQSIKVNIIFIDQRVMSKKINLSRNVT